MFDMDYEKGSEVGMKDQQPPVWQDVNRSFLSVYCIAAMLLEKFFWFSFKKLWMIIYDRLTLVKKSGGMAAVQYTDREVKLTCT